MMVAMGLVAPAWVSAQQRQGANPEAAPGSSTPMNVSTPLTAHEHAFVRAVAQADVFQIDAASLAGRKAQSPRVKSLAQRLLASYARMRMELERIARERGISLPSAPSRGQRALLEHLRALGGATFDRAYARTALDENQRNVARMQQAAASIANDRQLRTFAEAQVPALEQNVREARASVAARRG